MDDDLILRVLLKLIATNKEEGFQLMADYSPWTMSLPGLDKIWMYVVGDRICMSRSRPR